MKKIIYTLLVLGPTLALAQQTVGTVTDAFGTTFQTLRTFFTGSVFPFFIALAIIFFLWGLVQFVRAAGDEKAREVGKSHMIWGIVALVVMVSIVGIVNFIASSTGLQGGALPTTPTI